MLKHMHELRNDRPGLQSLDDISTELQPCYTEGQQRTFSTVAQTQHLASYVTMCQVNLPTIYWLDEHTRKEFEYRGSRIHVDTWAQMIHAVQDHQEELLKDLLLDQNDLLINFAGKRVVDDPHNQTYGHSILKDPRNSDVFYPDGDTEVLLHRIANTPSLRKKFFRRSQDGKWEVLQTAARKWLTKYAELNKDCMVCLTLSGGGPARSTELTALNYANGRDGDIRNLLAYGNLIYIAKTYSKVEPMRNGPRTVVPDVLDARLSYVVMINLAILRPFAIHLVSEVYRGNDQIMELYHNKLFVSTSRLFVCDDLSSALAGWTSKILGISFTLRHIRQMMVALKNYVAGEDIEDDINAVMSSHTLEVERARYAVCRNVPERANAQLWERVIQACRRMHILFKIVPGKLRVCVDLEHLHLQPGFQLVCPGKRLHPLITRASIANGKSISHSIWR
ncbi:unnamed protein product [Peniophora sp. CBMAI 1063]|nr:unnamed protein product [Peniophora sp. CBMAI 1063]